MSDNPYHPQRAAPWVTHLCIAVMGKLGRAGAGLLLLAVSALAIPAVAADRGVAAQHEIRVALQRWRAAFNAGNVDHVCDLFSHNLIAQYQGQPERNYHSLCDLLKKSLRDKRHSYRYSLRIQEIQVSGDLAVARLVWTLTLTSGDRGQKQTIDEPGIDIFRRQADRRWKITRYIAYSVVRARGKCPHPAIVL